MTKNTEQAHVGTCVCGWSVPVATTTDIIIEIVADECFRCPNCARPVVRWHQVALPTRLEVHDRRDYDFGS